MIDLSYLYSFIIHRSGKSKDDFMKMLKILYFSIIIFSAITSFALLSVNLDIEDVSNFVMNFFLISSGMQFFLSLLCVIKFIGFAKGKGIIEISGIRDISENKEMSEKYEDQIIDVGINMFGLFQTIILGIAGCGFYFFTKNLLFIISGNQENLFYLSLLYFVYSFISLITVYCLIEGSYAFFRFFTFKEKGEE